MINLLASLGDNIALWILGALTLVVAGAYFFFTHFKRMRGRSKLLEFCFIVLVTATLIIPMTESESLKSGFFLAVLGLGVYVIGRLICLFK